MAYVSLHIESGLIGDAAALKIQGLDSATPSRKTRRHLMITGAA
jgi:hypothetical protein